MFLDRLSYLGDGSVAIGFITLAFSLIGLVQAFIAFLMWEKYFLEKLERKAQSSWGFWLPIILSTFGWAALFKFLTKFY